MKKEKEKREIYRCEGEGLVTMPPLLNNVFDHPACCSSCCSFSPFSFFSSQFTENQGIVALLLAPLVDCTDCCIIPNFTENQVLRWLSQRDKGHPLGDSKGFAFVETTLNVIYLFILKTTIMKAKILNVVGFLSEDVVDGKKTTRVNYKVTLSETYEGRDKDGKKTTKNAINVGLTTICSNIMPYGVMIQSYVAQHSNKLVISDVLSAFIVGSDIEFDTQIQPIGTIINGEPTKAETCKITIKSIKPVENPILESFRLQMIADLPKRVEKLVEEIKSQAKAVLPNPFAMVATPTTPVE